MVQIDVLGRDSLPVSMPCNVLGDLENQRLSERIFLDVEITSSQHHGICALSLNNGNPLVLNAYGDQALSPM